MLFNGSAALVFYLKGPYELVVSDVIDQTIGLDPLGQLTVMGVLVALGLIADAQASPAVLGYPPSINYVDVNASVDKAKAEAKLQDAKQDPGLEKQAIGTTGGSSTLITAEAQADPSRSVNDSSDADGSGRGRSGRGGRTGGRTGAGRPTRPTGPKRRKVGFAPVSKRLSLTLQRSDDEHDVAQERETQVSRHY